jgi:NADPH:quinone reductase-like Zn-dependent oxidoreductase
MMGAEIYATVGNEEKIQYLMSTFGIPRGRIFNSRDISFLKDVLRETDGRGVDLVLNSLSGELLHASWECVAEFGTLLEIGKRDFIGHGKLAMSIFEANRSYAGIDLGHLIEVKPSVGKRSVISIPSSLLLLPEILTFSTDCSNQLSSTMRKAIFSP